MHWRKSWTRESMVDQAIPRLIDNQQESDIVTQSTGRPSRSRTPAEKQRKPAAAVGGLEKVGVKLASVPRSLAGDCRIGRDE